MNTVKGYAHVAAEQARKSLVSVGVKEEFVAELGDDAAQDLLEGIKRLMKMREQVH
jgi:hypothetical protein